MRIAVHRFSHFVAVLGLFLAWNLQAGESASGSRRSGSADAASLLAVLTQEQGKQKPSAPSQPQPEQQSAIERSEVPAQLPTVDLNAIFASVTRSGTGKELRLDLGEMVRMALANNADIKVSRIEPEVARTDVSRAWSVFDPKLGLQTQYSMSDTPQNAQQYIATGGSTPSLVDSYNAFAASQQATLTQVNDYKNQVLNYANQLADYVKKSGSAGGFPVWHNPNSPPPAPVKAASVLLDPNIYNSDDFSMQWGLGGQLPLGTRYSLSLNQINSTNDINRQLPPALFSPEYTTVASLSLVQPLLKNFGPAANMAGVRIARIQKRIGWYDWQQQMIHTLSEAIYRYYDLVFAYENARVRLEAVDAARLLERQNIQRVEQGKKRPSDVWDAQTALAFNVDLALRAFDSYAEAQSNLKAAIFTDKMAFSGQFGRLVPVTRLELPPIKVNRGDFLSEALANRPEYLEVISKAEQEGIRVRYARNQAYPEVNLQGTYGVTGLQGNYSDSFNKAFGGQGTAYSFGVGVSIPLGNVEGRANLEAAKLRQEQANLAIQKVLTSMASEIDYAISSVEISRRQVTAAQDAADSARKTADAELRLLEEGKSTTFEVVRLQNNAAEASSRELAAMANYQKTVIRLAVARGKLLDDLGISLEKEATKSVPPGKKKKLDLPVAH